MPDISWDEEEATNICYAQMTSGYMLGRFLDKRHFSREEFPSSTPQGLDDFPELCSRWFEGVLSIDWVNNLGDKFLINVSNLLGGVMLFDHLEEVGEYI